MIEPFEVAVYKTDAQEVEYPREAPFHPDEHYPEYNFQSLSTCPNLAYSAVRQCFRIAGLDADRYGTRAWNPLRGLVKPGETVMLKPNLIKESHPRDPEGWRYVMTHGSVIRAVADYVFKALGESGKIIVADAPQADSSFRAICRVLALDQIADFYHSNGLNFELIDLRAEEVITYDGVVASRTKLPGDPYGTVKFNLGAASAFEGHQGSGRYYGSDYNTDEVNSHHSGGKHEYLLSGTAINCDVFFNLPKLKTHKKAGITVALKNLVGINADKNWLPHHTEGNPRNGGDEHPQPGLAHRLERVVVRSMWSLSRRIPRVGPRIHRSARKVGRNVFGDTETVIRSGNWYGNDTVWRMCLDLNSLLLYGNGDGTIREGLPKNRKRYYTLVDGIIAGEGRGPMNPDPIPAGILLFATNPATADAASAWLMGFDPERIPIVREAFQKRPYGIAEWSWRDVKIVANLPQLTGRLLEISHEDTYHFKPHFGWLGQIERLLQSDRIVGER